MYVRTYVRTSGARSGTAREPPVGGAAFLRSFRGIVYFPIVGLFSAAQTSLGNGFSCQRSVINTATGRGLNNRLIVVFLKGQPAYSSCHHG